MTTLATTHTTLGYVTEGDGFEPIVQPIGLLYTQGFIICSKCKTRISKKGGPLNNAVCVQCYTKGFK